MAAQEKMRRLLKMLVLLSTGVRRSKQELSRHMGLSIRTIERYINTFRGAGFVVDNLDGCYQIEKNTGNGRSISDLLVFSEEEALILNKAIHAIDDNNIIKQNLTAKLYALYDKDWIRRVIIHRQNSENVHTLFMAIQYKKQVILKHYHSANSDKISDRVVEPFSFTTNFMNIWCYEPATKQNRMFKTARIGKVEMLENDWLNESRHKEGFTDVFRMSSNERLKVKLHLSLRAAHLLTEEYPLAANFISETENVFLFETDVCTYDGVGRFVLGLPGEAEVIGSEEFREYLRHRVNRRKW